MGFLRLHLVMYYVLSKSNWARIPRETRSTGCLLKSRLAQYHRCSPAPSVGAEGGHIVKGGGMRGRNKVFGGAQDKYAVHCG